MSFFIQNPFTGNVIDIRAASAKAGALLDAFPAKTGHGENSANQQWQFVPDPKGSGYYFIQNPLTGNAIDLQGASTTDGTLLDAYPMKTASNQDPSNQLWQLVSDPAGSGSYFIQNKLTGHVIDIAGASTASGAALNAFPMKMFNNANQLWSPLAGQFPPAVTMASPPANLGSFNQYVLSGGANPVPLKNITVTIDVIEDIVTNSLGIQLNGFSQSKNSNVDFQQYGIQLLPLSNQLNLFAETWPPNPPSGSDGIFNQGVHLLTLPQNFTIPAGYKIVIELVNRSATDATVTGVKATVYDGTTQVGTNSILLNLGQQDMAPMVAFQVVVVAWADSEHALLTSGMGTITCQSAAPLTPSINWPPYSDGDNGTAESSNCLYGLVPAPSSLSVVQTFGVSLVTPNLTAIVQNNEIGYDVSYSGTGLIPGVTYSVYFVGNSINTTELGSSTADKNGNINGVGSYICGSGLPSVTNIVLQAFTISNVASKSPIAISTPFDLNCTPG
jgi:hypothetical protein